MDFLPRMMFDILIPAAMEAPPSIIVGVIGGIAAFVILSGLSTWLKPKFTNKTS